MFNLSPLDFARSICINCRDSSKPEYIGERVLFDRAGGTLSGLYAHLLGKIDGKERAVPCAASSIWETERLNNEPTTG